MADPLRVITQTESWKQEANQSAIRLLEEWLEKAKAGEIVAVALVGEGVDGLMSREFTRPRSRMAMIGALADMQYHLHRDMERED
jgi:predicted hydrolase (HD superfamily)